MLSTAQINAALTRAMNDTFLEEVRMAGKEDDKWSDRAKELVKRKENGEKLPDDWMESNGLLYYKNQLYIPANEALQTRIANGCHDSQVAGHFGQGKTIKIVTRDF